MAKKRRRSPKVNRDIQKIITFLEGLLNTGELCYVGQERLRWWKRNKFKFNSVREALSTWSANQLTVWLDYIDMWWEDYDEDWQNLEEAFTAIYYKLTPEQKKLKKAFLAIKPSEVELILANLTDNELIGF